MRNRKLVALATTGLLGLSLSACWFPPPGGPGPTCEDPNEGTNVTLSSPFTVSGCISDANDSDAFTANFGAITTPGGGVVTCTAPADVTITVGGPLGSVTYPCEPTNPTPRGFTGVGLAGIGVGAASGATTPADYTLSGSYTPVGGA